VISQGSLKSLMLLWQSVASEEAAWCHTSTHQDFKTVQMRCEKEGASFLTITLPTFGKDFERSLDRGYVDRTLFTGFQWKAGLPRFLSGFLGQIFAIDSGSLVDEPSVDAIRAVRQLTLMFGKIKLPCTPAREAAAMKGFVDCEKTVREMDNRRSQSDNLVFHRVSRLIWADVFTEVDRKVFNGEILPKHGPGATQDKLLGNKKFENRTWTERLEESFFPAIEHMFSSDSHYWSSYDQVNWLEPGQEPPVKVTPVPKTPKAPRIIAIEPSWMMYCQQALLGALKTEIEKGDSRSAFVGLTHQEPNQVLASEGSKTQTLATLDLSEASDRVSDLLVQTMLADHPNLRAAVDACRSKTADVLGHGVIPLAKFASMGSALCFPFEAMVFTTVIFVGIQKALKRPLTKRDLELFRGQVRVYGDDIIVPVRFVEDVIESLELFGFKVNSSKSFWTGKFRESCGMEFYDGTDVTLVRVRHEFPTSRQDVTALVGVVSLRNQLYKAGLWKTAHYLDEIIERVIPFPVVAESSAVLGRISALGYETRRLHRHTHKPLVKGWTVRPIIPSNSLDGIDALLKNFLKTGAKVFDVEYLEQIDDLAHRPFHDKKHLERSGRPVRVDMMYGWVQPF